MSLLVLSKIIPLQVSYGETAAACSVVTERGDFLTTTIDAVAPDNNIVHNEACCVYPGRLCCFINKACLIGDCL